ncbi:TRAP transporter small permease [Ramlibacter rhizophilus]|uniref:TRAP transporter small permease protein n=2 Tax=Ramlibacter rhizophilus TaxID=1781167 RepID=A0A4Z0BPQ0_9BURK|nr:TRAP transporter small permease [Ramlibacter rhizophilus]
MVLANVAGRAMRSPIYWIDELSVLVMVWLAMIGMSLTLKTRDAVAVTMLVDAVPPLLMKIMRILIDLLVLVFGITLLVLCYRWFDPLTLMRVGFDTREFSGQTFNFMYQDTTATLGVAKFWFWLVVPLVAVTTSVHALSNLLRTVATPASVGIASGLPAPLAGNSGANQ